MTTPTLPTPGGDTGTWSTELNDYIGGMRGAGSIVVAASNAPDKWKVNADYLCDGTADDVEVQAAVTAAAGTNRVVLSPGSFVFSGGVTLTSRSADVGGASAGSTSVQCAASQTAFMISPSAASIYQKPYLHDMTITGTGAAQPTNSTTGITCTGGTSSAILERIRLYRLAIGVDLNGAQFWTCNDVTSQESYVGWRVTQDSSAGGGNNNSFRNCHTQGDFVSWMVYPNSIYPFGQGNVWDNCFVDAATLTGSYHEGGNSGLWSYGRWVGLAHENCGSYGSASATVMGKTVKRSLFYLNNKASLTCPNFYPVDSVGNKIRLDTGSYLVLPDHPWLTIPNAGITVDGTSFVHKWLGVPGSETYSVTNPTTDRALNVTGDTLAQVAAFVGTMAADLQARGILS